MDLASDYRTRITNDTNVDPLQTRTIGLDGIIVVTWDGSGSRVVTQRDWSRPVGDDADLDEFVGHRRQRRGRASRKRRRRSARR